MGTELPLPKKAADPPSQFMAHVYCGQTARWIKMALGTEVGLGPGHIVLNGDPAPLPQKGAKPPPPNLAHFYSARNARIASDIVFVQELWLHSCELYPLNNLHSEFVVFAKSSMDEHDKCGLSVGRPYGGVAVFVT